MWRYLREFLSDPRVIEMPRVLWYPILYGLVLTTRPQKIRRKIQDDLEQGEGRIAAAHHHPRAGRAAGRTASRTSPTSWSNGACATAIRRSPAPSTGWPQQAATASCCCPLYPQYSATTTATANDKLFRALMKMRRMPTVRCVPALLRRACLYRGAGAFDRTAPRRPRLPAGGGRRLLSRHSARLFRTRRPLSLPLPEDDAAAARTARLGREEADHHLPVALRRAGMAAALHRQDRREAGARRRKIDRRRQSRLLGRLHRDAGRDRHARSARLSMRPAARIFPISLASTTATTAWT